MFIYLLYLYFFHFESTHCFVGCVPSLPTLRHPRVLSPAALSPRHTQEHHSAHELRGSSRAGHPEQPQVEHLPLPHHPSGSAQRVSGGPGRHHWQQGEDSHLHAFDEGQPCSRTGKYQRK